MRVRETERVIGSEGMRESANVSVCVAETDVIFVFVVI